MNIVMVLLVGLVSGFLAGKLVEGHGFGTLGDIIVGIVGAAVGSPLFAAFGAQAYGILGAILMSTFGAVVLLFAADLFRVVIRRRKEI